MRSERWHGACLLLIAVVALLAYGNAFDAELTLDSRFIVGKDTRIRALTPANVSRIVRSDYWDRQSDLYRPLTTLSYLCNYAVLGNEARPFGYHLVNLLLHALNGCLLYLLIHALLRRADLALITAALWTAHPVATEAVTNIVGRADLMATAAVLLGAVALLRARASGARRWWIALALAAWCAALSKESGVLLLALMILMDLCFGLPGCPAGTDWRRCARKSYLALAPALVTFAAVRLIFVPRVWSGMPHSYTDNPIAHAGALEGFLTAVQVQGRYLALLCFPRELSCDYSFDQIPLCAASDALAWVGLAGGIALLASVLLLRARRTYVFGVLCYLLLMLPTSNLLLPIGSVMGERFLYLPSIGFCLVVAAGLVSLADTLPRAGPVLRVLLPLLLVGAGAMRTRARNLDWHDARSLWRSAMRVCPESIKPYSGLAMALAREDGSPDGLDAAIALLQRGQRILDRADLQGARRNNRLLFRLGVLHARKSAALLAQQREARAPHERATAYFAAAIEIEASHRQVYEQRARDRGAPILPWGDARLHVQAASNHIDWGEWDEALRRLEDARGLALEAGTCFLLAEVHERKGQTERAAEALFQAYIMGLQSREATARLLRLYAGQGLRMRTLNQQHPRVRADRARAAVSLYQLLRRAGQRHQARQLRTYARREWGMDDARFSD